MFENKQDSVRSVVIFLILPKHHHRLVSSHRRVQWTQGWLVFNLTYFYGLLFCSSILENFIAG